MNKRHIIKSLNLSGGDCLTLEKAADRVEFEALPVFLDARADCDKCSFCDCNGTKCGCNDYRPICVLDCATDGTPPYIPCPKYK